MNPHQQNSQEDESKEMVQYVIDYGRPILEQLIENISKRQAKKVFRNVFIATDILNSGETLFMPLNNGLNLQAVQTVFKNGQCQKQNEHGENVYTTIHKLAVSEDQLIGQTNIAFSDHMDEQIQFMIKDEKKTFLMSCCRQQILNKKHLGEYFPVLRRKLKILKPVNEQLINYFNVELPQKLQDEQDRKLYQKMLSSLTPLKEKAEILQKLGDKYEILKEYFSRKVQETYYVTEEFMNSVNLTFKEKVVTEMSVIQKEMFSIRYYKCFQNIYYYFQMSYNTLQYLKVLYPLEEKRAKIDSSSSSGMDSGVIEHISENILLSLFEPLHEAFKASVMVDMNNTNKSFRQVIKNNQYHIVQLIKMVLQIHAVQHLENKINQLYNVDIYNFLRSIEHGMKEDIDNKLNVFTDIIKTILNLLNVSYKDQQILITRSKQYQEDFNQELETVLSQSLIVQLTMDQNIQIQAYLGLLMDIKRQILWLQQAYKTFDKQLLDLINFNQSDMGDFYAEYKQNPNTDIMTKKSKDLFYHFNKMIGGSMNQFVIQKYKQLMLLENEYKQLLLHRHQIHNEIEDIIQRIKNDNIQVVLDESDRQSIIQSRDEHSLQVSQRLSANIEV